MTVKTYKILIFLKRKPGMSIEAFRRHYEEVHAPLALKYARGLKHYTRRFLDPLPNPETGRNDELPYDVITELWFDDEAIFRGTVEYMSTSLMPDDVIADEENLFDRSKNRIATVVEYESKLPTTSAIEAREADILGQPQRITPLKPEEFDQDATDLVLSVRGSLGVTEMDQIPPVFGVMLRHPGLFRCQMEMGVQLLGKGVICRRERELAILRVGWFAQAPYEWGEHVDIAKRYGVSEEEIERVTRGSADPGWNEHDSAILKAVEELLENQMISDETWNVLARTWDERQLIELPVLVGIYYTIALQQNSLRIRLADDNQGLRQR